MPVAFQILPQHNLVLVHYSGFVTLAESLAAKAACGADPEFRPWMRHLVDCTGVTGYEQDFVGYAAMQAQTTDHFPQTHDLIIVFHAPTRPGQELAELARRSWDGLERVIVMIQTDETRALSLLGLPVAGIADLGATTE